MKYFHRNCTKLMITLNINIICYNNKNYFINDIFDEKFSLIFEKNEMKKIIEMKSSSIAVNAHNVTIDELYDHFEENSILRITLNFDESIYTEEIVDMNIAKKRKLDQTS